MQRHPMQRQERTAARADQDQRVRQPRRPGPVRHTCQCRSPPGQAVPDGWLRDFDGIVFHGSGHRSGLPGGAAKPIRDALGLLPGTKVDITPYGAGAQLLPAGRTARLIEEDGVLVADADTPVDDDTIFALIDAGRK